MLKQKTKKKKKKKKTKKTYPSIYKAAQFLDQFPQTVRYWSRKKGYLE